MTQTKKRIMVGLSGGVDSSVTALLLKESGYTVEAAFMKNWEEEDETGFCPASIDFADAQAVCDKLDIELHSINFSKEYWEQVFSYFLDEYRAGRTPNPDILCNKEIKFKVFLNYAKQKGAEILATGHYAQNCQQDGYYQLLKGLDPEKDQSYFLHALNQEQLAHSIFPVGHLNKADVRALAKKAGLPTHIKKDSVGICFIGERKFKAFLNDYLPAQPGLIESDEGKLIGQHDGLMFYTLGQRQGLKIGGQKDKEEAPWYVLAKDLERNRLIVGQGQQHPKLYTKTLLADRMHWIASPPTLYPFRCKAKTRYRQADQACWVEVLDSGQYQVTFDEPQRSVTPGQSVVFYEAQVCLGGGVIL
jgi:tRNA-specific 2-thiouridylase